MPYAFTQEDFRKFQDDVIKAGGDQATLTSLLSDMQTTFTESMALVETTKNENEAITAENGRLKDSNMKLFLQVGEQAKAMQTGKPESPLGGEEPESKFQSADEYMQAYFEKLDKKG